MNPPNPHIIESLAQFRKDLLDLSPRNTLIHFKHLKSTLRLANTSPTRIHEILLSGQSITFVPVPAPGRDGQELWSGTTPDATPGKRPTAEEWARQSGMDLSLELPRVNTLRGTRVQTPYFPDPLEVRLEGIAKLARTAVEESGTNLLHLVLGFLEWYESEESDKARHSPLYIVPVILQKGGRDEATNTDQFSLRLESEEVQFNASLAARLKEDFGFALPEPGEDCGPEEYLGAVAASIPKKFSRWRVCRWGTLGLLNFSRLLMYRDLDPANWPEDRPLAGHPLVKDVITGEAKTREQKERPEHFGEEPEYEIDQVEGIHDDFPVVDVADSSQHSALIDVMRGKNLVIQGPPGTGKSQTITNLIAAALNRGLTVLFVSEKMAALEVVARRMEKLGLGSFCLELHSHTTKKLSVMESLLERVQARFPQPRALDEQILSHTQLQDILIRHVHRVNQPWHKTGKSIHEILMAAVRHREGLPEPLALLRVQSMSVTSWDVHRQEAGRREVRSLHGLVQKIRREIGTTDLPGLHPWRGLGLIDLDAQGTQALAEALLAWQIALQELSARTCEFLRETEDFPAKSTAAHLAGLAECAVRSPGPGDRVLWPLLPQLKEERFSALDRELDRLQALAGRAETTGKLDHARLAAHAELDEYARRVNALLASGLQPACRLAEAVSLPHACHSVLNLAAAWQTRLAEFARQAAETLPEFMDPSRVSLRNLQTLLRVVTLAAGLPTALHAFRNPRLLASQCPGILTSFTAVLEPLRKERDELARRFHLDAARATVGLAGLADQVPPCAWIKRLLNGSYRKAKRALKPLLKDPATGWDAMTMQSQLRELGDYLHRENLFVGHAEWTLLFGGLFRGVDTDLSAVTTLVEWHAELERQFATVEGELFQTWTLGVEGRWLLEAATLVLQRLPVLTKAGLEADTAAMEADLGRVAAAYGHTAPPAEAVLCTGEDPWVGGMAQIQLDAPPLAGLDSVLRDFSEATLAHTAEVLATYQTIRGEMAESEQRYAALNQDFYQEGLPASPWPLQQVQEAVRPTRYWVLWLTSTATPKALARRMLEEPGSRTADLLLQWGGCVQKVLAGETKARVAFQNAAQLDTAAWVLDGDLRSGIERAQSALAGLHLLPDFLAYRRTLAWLQGIGLGELAEAMGRSDYSLETCIKAYEHAVHATHVQALLAHEPELRRFSAVRHAGTQGDFVETDKRLMDLMRRKVAARAANRKVPPGTRGARVADLSEGALLQNEITKERRHIPIRQLLMRAGKAVQALKPCFMMGPRSVAQYLAPEGVTFDLLVIDEASQMRPADALGAVARCAQLVVVGDSKQLAPSGYFDRVAGGDDQEEPEEKSTAREAASILDAVAPIFATRYLKWHYRSKHESLIAFSNQEFYDSKLLLFPSPRPAQGDLGVRYVSVPDGVFANNTNRPEALAIVRRVEELLLKTPMLSLGIATMNAKQRDLIDALIADRAKANPAFGAMLAENQAGQEPVFFKNLENVQGDERDVILISTTYGRNPESNKVHQQFGPINWDTGWRRLNVLFTRSRMRMEIFSSMSYSDIQATETSSRGVKALQGMLKYAETNRLTGARVSGREPDSDFEVAVANLLSVHGYAVDCQIGVSNFFIDLAVKCPRGTGTYVLGIECDGATYHSAKSARDRDRLRQEILEGLGWKIRRIWSTDWFANPQKAIQPILEELKAATD